MGMISGDTPRSCTCAPSIEDEETEDTNDQTHLLFSPSLSTETGRVRLGLSFHGWSDDRVMVLLLLLLHIVEGENSSLCQ